jgi:hypothetical protein
MSIHLKRDLDELHEHVLSMCAAVKDVVHKAVADLRSLDTEVSKSIIDRDGRD